MIDYDARAGQRVLAIHTINNDEKYVTVFGRGKLLGSAYPEGAVGPVAEEVRAEGADAKNVKIELDGGEIIWGCECWWMDGYKGDMWLMELASLKYDIRDISITDMREAYLKEVNDGLDRA